MTDDPFKPSVAVLCKLGSIVVHADEMIGPGGHDFDVIALRSLLNDAEVKQWLVGMNALAMLPRKRT